MLMLVPVRIKWQFDYSLDADANGYWLSGFTDGYASTDFYDAIYKNIHSLRSTM